MSDCRILIVDDEPTVHEVLRPLLRRCIDCGDVVTASNADEALAILHREPIDIIMTAVSMPGRSGLELLTEIRNHPLWRELPVIVLVGAHEPDLKRRALHLDATDLLNKPIHPDDLTARVRSALRLKTAQDGLRMQNALLERKVQERTAELVQSRLEIIWRLARAAEFRDEETGNHVIRVGCYSRVLADALDLDPQEVETIFLSAPLHDIGKIGVPDGILLKEGSLTPAEWRVMRSHCEIGEQILSKAAPAGHAQRAWRALWPADGGSRLENPLLSAAASIALHHHERWDGGGYPRGLAGEEIPLPARIVTLADTFDAMSSDRPYRRALPEERVLEILREERGRQFDPQVVAAFERVRDRLREIQHEFADVPRDVARTVAM